MVSPRFVERALRDEPILVYGDGLQSRCFSSVHDVVRGVLMLAQEPSAIGEVFNIGTQEEVSVAELARRIKAMTGSASPIEAVEYEAIYGTRFEDMQRRVPSLDKIKAMVGYQPQVTLDQLLRDTIEHVKARTAAATPTHSTTAAR